MTVRLDGGPPDWNGASITADPDDDGDPAVWHFRGWIPASPTDPPPEAYQHGMA